MSATIDNRVVEMQFDNSQFEKNIQVSLKSLEELKKGLELDKAAASLSNLEKAANKFDLSSIENAVTSLQQRFSTLGIIGMTALENITNKAVNAGVQMVKSLSVDQIASGMSKYEAETGSVATMQYAIKDGLTEEGTRKIYENIEKLQSYADETSYSFSTMVDNMGKFVNAGVDLEKAEQSMEGIANWAAKSGVSAQSANFGRVMYNLSQAMGQGTVKLMDWMSIENAQMATMDFKNEVLEAAVAMGTLTKKGNEYYTKASKGNKSVKVTAEDMRNTLQKGWFTADVLTKVLGKYADRTTEFGKEAFLAAQQARTFTDAIEAAKDAVSTGWSRSFRIIFGDVKQATELFTGMANGIIEVVDGVQEFRNSMLSAWAANKGRDNLIQGFANIWHMLQGISTEVQRAFGWLTNGIADQYGEKLAELSEGFKNFTEKGLGLFDTHKITEVIGGTSKVVTGGLEDISNWSAEAEKSIRGMISKKMKPATVDQWNEAADAIKDLNEYVNSGSVDTEVYMKKLGEVNNKIEALKKTNKLSGNKQKGLTQLLKTMEKAGTVQYELEEVQKKIGDEGVETETTISYYSNRLRPIIAGMSNMLLIFKDALSVTGNKMVEFVGQFKPLIFPALDLASAIGDLIVHIRETGIVSETLSGWLNQIAGAFSPVIDKIDVAVGWFNTLREAIYNKNYTTSAFFDSKNWTFFNGPIGEKILNVAKGVKAFGDIVVRTFAASIRSTADFVSTFLIPLAGPLANAALNFFSGIGKLLVGLNEGFLSAGAINRAVEWLHNFFDSIKSQIISNPFIQRAKTILTSFFNIFSKDPKAAINYLKAVGRGLMEGVKKSELYKKAAGYIDSFVKGIKATIKNSKLLKKAKVFTASFFKAFKKDPIAAIKALGRFVKNFVMLSKPVQILKDFAKKVEDFLKGLFPNKAVSKVVDRMNLWKRNFQKVFETKGLQGVFSLAKNMIVKKLSELGDAFAKSPIGKKIEELKKQIVKVWNNLVIELRNNPIVQKVKSLLSQLSEAYSENGISGAIALLKEKIIGKFNELKAAFLQNGIVKAAIVLKDRIKLALTNFADRVGLGEKIEKFKKWLEDLKKTFEEKGPITALTKLKNTLMLKFQTFTANFNLTKIVEKVKEWGKALVDAIKEVNVGEAFDALKEAIKEKLKGLFPSAEESMPKETDESKGIISSISAWVGNLVTVLQGKLSEALKKMNVAKVLGTLFSIGSAIVGAKIVWSIMDVVSAFGKWGQKTSGQTFEKGMTAVSKVIKNVAIAFGVLAASLLVLSLIPKEQLDRSISAITTCLTSIALMAGGIKMLGLEAAMKSIMQAGIGISAIGFAILELAAAISWLARMDFVKEFLKGLGMVGLLIVGLGAFIVAMNKFGAKGFTGDWKTTLAEIIAIAGAVLILTVAVKSMAKLTVGKAIQGVLGVAALLLAFSGAIAIINKFSGDQKTTVMKVIQLLAVSWAIGGLVKSVQKIGKMDPWAAARGIGGVLALMAALTGVFIAMNKLAADNPAKIGGIIVSAIAMMALVYVFSEAVLKVANVPWQTMIAFAGSFGIFVLSMSGALTILAAIPFPAIMGAVAGLGAAIIAIGGAVSLAIKLGGDAMQALSGNMWVVASKLSQYSNMVANLNTSAINNSIQIMKDFASVAIEVIGTPSLSGFGKIMIDMGADLSMYNTNISNLDTTKFNTSIQAMKDFSAASDEVSGKDYTNLSMFGKTMQQVGSNLRLYSLLTADIDVSKSQLIKTAAADIGEIYESLKDVKDVGDLTTAITNIGSALSLYYSQVNGITVPEDSGDGPDLSKIQQIFTDLAAAMPEPTTITDISSYAAGGGNDMTQFALGLEAIGTALKNLGTNVEGVTAESIKPSLDLIKTLTILNNVLKPERFSLDFLGAFHVESEKGEADIQQFATDIVALGGAIKDYGDQVKDVTPEKIGTSLDALDFFRDLREKLNEKGWNGFSFDFLTKFHADKTQVDTFAEDIIKLGGAVRDFANSLKGEEGKGLDSAQIEIAKSTISFVGELSNTLGKTGGIKQLFDGSVNLDTFASQLGTLGDGVAQYADAIKGHDFSAAEAASKPLVALARAQNMIQGVAQWTGLDSFAQMLSGVGPNLLAFQTGAEGVDPAQCNTIITSLNALIAAAQEWSTYSNAQSGAVRMRDFLNELANGTTGIFGGNHKFAELAGTLATDFWSAFYTAINDQNGTYGVEPTGFNLAPTIKPVYDMSNVKEVGGTVNGQLQSTLDTTGLSMSVSDIAAGIDGSMMSSKLELTNSYLASLVNTTSEIRTANHADLQTVTSSIDGLHDALSFTINLDGQQIAVTIAPMVDKILGHGIKGR